MSSLAKLHNTVQMEIDVWLIRGNLGTKVSTVSLISFGISKEMDGLFSV